MEVMTGKITKDSPADRRTTRKPPKTAARTDSGPQINNSGKFSDLSSVIKKLGSDAQKNDNKIATLEKELQSVLKISDSESLALSLQKLSELRLWPVIKGKIASPPAIFNQRGQWAPSKDGKKYVHSASGATVCAGLALLVKRLYVRLRVKKARSAEDVVRIKRPDYVSAYRLLRQTVAADDATILLNIKPAIAEAMALLRMLGNE